MRSPSPWEPPWPRSPSSKLRLVGRTPARRGPTPQPFSPSQSYMQDHGEGSLLGPTQIPRTKDEADDPASVESVEDKWGS
ncbi:hypothetical protein LEMLEM_LOCUS16414 [Lemmus lemmus]